MGLFDKAKERSGKKKSSKPAKKSTQWTVGQNKEAEEVNSAVKELNEVGRQMKTLQGQEESSCESGPSLCEGSFHPRFCYRWGSS